MNNFIQCVVRKNYYAPQVNVTYLSQDVMFLSWNKDVFDDGWNPNGEKE